MVDLYSDGTKPKESWMRPPGRHRRIWLSHNVMTRHDLNARSLWTPEATEQHNGQQPRDHDDDDNDCDSSTEVGTLVIITNVLS